MSTDVDRLRRHFANPTRDWRFWAAMSVALLVACTTIGMVAVIHDRNDWRDRFEIASSQQACRSKASADVNFAGYQLLGAIGQEVIALNDKDEAGFHAIAKVIPDLKVSLDKALARQQEAVQKCNDPAYVKEHT